MRVPRWARSRPGAAATIVASAALALAPACDPGEPESAPAWFEYSPAGMQIFPPVVGHSVDDLWASDSVGMVLHRTAAGWATVDPLIMGSSYAVDSTGLWVGGWSDGPAVVRVRSDLTLDDRSAALPVGGNRDPSVAARGDDVVLAMRTSAVGDVRLLVPDGAGFVPLADLSSPATDAEVLAVAGPGEALVRGSGSVPAHDQVLHVDDGVEDVPIDPVLAPNSFRPRAAFVSGDAWVWWLTGQGAMRVVYEHDASWQDLTLDPWAAEAGQPFAVVPLGDGEAVVLGAWLVRTSPESYSVRAARLDSSGALDAPVPLFECDTGPHLCEFAPHLVSTLTDGTIVILDPPFGWFTGVLEP